MRKLFAVLLSVAGITLAVEAQTVWIGYAASTDGRYLVGVTGGEPDAREVTRQMCESQTLRQCNAISVHLQSYVYIVHCSNGFVQNSFLGGSNRDLGAAEWRARMKANQQLFQNQDCRPIFVHRPSNAIF